MGNLKKAKRELAEGVSLQKKDPRLMDFVGKIEKARDALFITTPMRNTIKSIGGDKWLADMDRAAKIVGKISENVRRTYHTGNLKEDVSSLNEKKGVSHKGKKIVFAELDGPFSAGIGSGGVEVSEYAILYVDDKDNEVALITFKDKKKALDHLSRLEKAGVEVSSLTS